MKIVQAVLTCLICSTLCLFGAAFAQAAPAKSHPGAVATATRALPEKHPGTTSQAKPARTPSLLARPRTTPNVAYHNSSNPAVIGRLAKPSATTPTALAGTRINRKP